MKSYTRLTQLLEELLPLLKKYQIYFLYHVDEIMESFVSNSNQRNYGNRWAEDSEIERKVVVMKKNLETIVERLKHELKEGNNDKTRFVQTYPKWREVRKNGIQKLNEIAESLKSVRFTCNVTKVVGHSTSLLGGGLCLASAILIPFSMGLTAPFAYAGGALTFAGCSTTIGTSITEILLLKSKVGYAQEIIEEDGRYFKEMCNWLKHAAELEEALAEVLNIDIVKDVVENVKSFVKEALEIQHEGIRRSFIKKTLNVIIKGLPNRLTEALSIFGIATFISSLVGLFVLLINTTTSIVLDCAHATVRSFLGIASFVDDTGDIVRVTSLFTSNASLAKDLSKAITRGALSVVGMALDVTGIVLSSIDIYDGSVSPEAEKISEASKALEKETETIDEVYRRLRFYS